MFMTACEIQWAAEVEHECPNVRKGVRLLLRLMEAVNSQSDGWGCWAPPSNSARKLVGLLRTAGNLPRGTHGTVSDADFKRAVSPIKAMATRQKRIQAKYGNTFDFDVDAALHEVK